MSTYYWPIDNSRARATAIIPWSTFLLIPVWSSGVAWILNPNLNTLSLAGVSAVMAPGIGGYADAAADGVSGAWLVQYSSGALQNYGSGGGVTGFALPVTGIFTGVAYSPVQNKVYAINKSGQIYAPS